MTDEQEQMTKEFNALIPELSNGSPLLDALKIILNNLKAVTAERDNAKALLTWFAHYIEDRQYENIIPDKDFELREALAKAKALLGE